MRRPDVDELRDRAAVLDAAPTVTAPLSDFPFRMKHDMGRVRGANAFQEPPLVSTFWHVFTTPQRVYLSDW